MLEHEYDYFTDFIRVIHDNDGGAGHMIASLLL
jgi:hypothetical protein